MYSWSGATVSLITKVLPGALYGVTEFLITVLGTRCSDKAEIITRGEQMEEAIGHVI